MAVNDIYDLIVIGAGPGGSAAAIKAAKAGLKTLIVEKDSIGGTCLNCGCIPTKALLHSSGIYRQAAGASAFGINCKPEIDESAIAEYRDKTVNSLVDGLRASLKASGAEVIFGTASIVSAGDTVTVSVTNSEGLSEYRAKNLILATGSETIIPDIPGVELDVVTDSDRLLKAAKLPESLVIIGGGVIGTEFASFFTDLGRKVTIIEGLPRILSGFDKEISRNAQMILKKRGADIHTGSRVTAISKAEDGSAVVVFETDGSENSVTAEAVMIAVGRKAVIELPDELGIKLKDGRIDTIGPGRTSVKNIFAIGDITSGQQLAHKASAQGENVVAGILDEDSYVCDEIIPACVYTSPEIACVGMTESEAEAAGIDVVSARALTSANAKSVLTGEERGFVKLVADRSKGILIGAQLMCANATDMIGELALSMSNAIVTIDDLNIVRAHPTYEEAIGDALKLLKQKM
ncbi:MAG: dihydrolipoyl dehydrogenase [Clostridiales bacterium]|nr:dihydrolipoyl dehydrogenase [Clostridiales bacterium]